jgi:murein L,D-transpeptidase YafK
MMKNITSLLGLSLFSLITAFSASSFAATHEMSKTKAGQIKPYHSTLKQPSRTIPRSESLQVDLVKVDKSKRRLYLLKDGKIIRSYRIALGANPKGHKQREGDNKTPEGRYYLDFVNQDSRFYKAIHVSYPNSADKLYAARHGFSAGGAINIHGLKNDDEQDPGFVQSFDWTNGCIALTNRQIDEFLKLVPLGTPIDIEW